jgi:hypothetical protein
MSKGKWELETALKFMKKNGHSVGDKQVKLGSGAGIQTFGCADYLWHVHKYTIIYPQKDRV